MTATPTDMPARPAEPRHAVERCAAVVSGKWTLLVVRELLDGPRSFSELEQALVGISPNTLSDRLQLLREHGVLTRTRIRGMPPRTIYAMTSIGSSLGPVVAAMRDVGSRLLSQEADGVVADA